jgi:hypothetical protein
MRVLSQALQIIFEVQKKKSNEKLTRKKKAFQLAECPFFSLSLWTPLTFKSHNFFIHFKRFKVV